MHSEKKNTQNKRRKLKIIELQIVNQYGSLMLVVISRKFQEISTIVHQQHQSYALDFIVLYQKVQVNKIIHKLKMMDQRQKDLLSSAQLAAAIDFDQVVKLLHLVKSVSKETSDQIKVSFLIRSWRFLDYIRATKSNCRRIHLIKNR